MTEKRYIELPHSEKNLHRLFKLLRLFVINDRAQAYRAIYLGDIFYSASARCLIASDGRKMIVVPVSLAILEPIFGIFKDKDMKLSYISSKKALVVFEDSLFVKYDKYINFDLSKHKMIELYLGGISPSQEYPWFYIKTGIALNQSYLECLKGWNWNVYFTDDKESTPVAFKETNFGFFVFIQPMMQNRMEDKQ